MKKCSFIFLLFVSLIGLGQSVPVQWEVTAQKTGEQTYELLIYGTIKKGWNVYSEKDAANDLDGINVSWENSTILKDGEIKIETEPVIYNDTLFAKRLKVFQGQVVLKQSIKIYGTIPAGFDVSVHGFASAKNEFVPIAKIHEVKLQDGIAATNNKISNVDITKPVADCGDIQDNN